MDLRDESPEVYVKNLIDGVKKQHDIKIILTEKQPSLYEYLIYYGNSPIILISSAIKDEYEILNTIFKYYSSTEHKVAYAKAKTLGDAIELAQSSKTAKRDQEFIQTLRGMFVELNMNDYNSYAVSNMNIDPCEIFKISVTNEVLLENQIDNLIGYSQQIYFVKNLASNLEVDFESLNEPHKIFTSNPSSMGE